MAHKAVFFHQASQNFLLCNPSICLNGCKRCISLLLRLALAILKQQCCEVHVHLISLKCQLTDFDLRLSSKGADNNVLRDRLPLCNEKITLVYYYYLLGFNLIP